MNGKTPTSPQTERKLLRELPALIFIFFAIMLTASLATYSQADPGMNHALQRPENIHNAVGLFGAYLSSALADLFGIAAFIWPIFFVLIALRITVWRSSMLWWRWLGFFLLGFCLVWGASAFSLKIGDMQGGGLLGYSLHSLLSFLLRPFGAMLLWMLATICSVQLLFELSFTDLAHAARTGILRLRIFARRFRAGRKVEPAPTAQKGAGKIEIRFPKSETEPEKTAEAPAGRPFALDRADEFSAESNVPGQDIFISQETRAGEQSPPLPPLLPPALPTPADELAPEKAPQAISEKPSLFNLSGKFSRLLRKGGAPVSAKSQSQEDQAAVAQAEVAEDPARLADALAQENLEPIPDWLSAAFGGPGQRPTTVTPSGTPSAAPAKAASSPSKAVKPKGTRRVPLPDLDLLASAGPGASRMQRDLLEEKGRKVMSCLADFSVQGELVGITPGPVVTMFEVRPAPGVKVSRIAGLSDDLALALKAIAVRIQAPIPGTDTVGIEIPNETRETVNFRELLASSAFKNAPSLLSMAIGKDIAGAPAVTDLARMPHLLVAGATGAGKSVCLNSILLSLLYKARPDEVRLLLIDPKRIELAVYEDLPHLAHPVVTETHHAKNALDWAVHEMERRYKAIARLSVRNIEGYNEKLASFGADIPENLRDLEPIPFLIIIIDELADLMLTASKEVETSIVRLAQLARAAGMHMILATQRPSVDVVTGLIKANFPCRISFQVTSKHDSRTILDTVGAEYLLGKGDMLFKPSGGRITRLHGAFVSDAEVASVVTYWKKQLPPSYMVDLTDWSSGGENNEMLSSGADGDDAQYAEAVDFVRSQGRASISQIQRRFRIGFNKAARYVEQMEQDGIIGPADGSRPREVVR